MGSDLHPEAPVAQGRASVQVQVGHCRRAVLLGGAAEQRTGARARPFARAWLFLICLLFS